MRLKANHTLRREDERAWKLTHAKHRKEARKTQGTESGGGQCTGAGSPWRRAPERCAGARLERQRPKPFKFSWHWNLTELIWPTWHGTFHPTTAETCYLQGRTLSENRLIWEQRTILKHFKRIQVMQCILSDHSGIKFKSYTRKISMKPPNNWKLNNILLANVWVEKRNKIRS